MVDWYFREVLDGENRVSRRCKSHATCTGHERSAITQIANGRERQYRVVLARPRIRCKANGLAPIGSDLRLRRSRTETTVRSRNHPKLRSPSAVRSGQARGKYRSTILDGAGPRAAGRCLVYAATPAGCAS